MATFYITKDPERAMGFAGLLEDYYVVCLFESSVTDSLRKEGVGVLALEDNIEGGSYGILKNERVREYIQNNSKNSTPNILVLKTSSLIEDICKENNWNLLAPRADIAKKYEDKISQYKALSGSIPFPETHIGILKDIKADSFPLILQFNKGHSGEGTHIIRSQTEIDVLAKKFPNREIRIARAIEGDTYTLNALVTRGEKIYTGSISLQLTGIKEATDNPLATVGNDFGMVKKNLKKSEIEKIGDIAVTLGKIMAKEGYVGFFGIDVVVEKGTENIFFVEANTHQPASISFEALLHEKLYKISLISIFARDIIKKEEPVNRNSLPLLLPINASQIIYRNKGSVAIAASQISPPDIKGVLLSRMREVGPGEELFRIQSYEDNNQLEIPKPALKVIEQYKTIAIAPGRTVYCPYYRNPKSGRKKWGLNAFSGKGSPKEIESEIKVIEKLERQSFSQLKDKEVRDIMRKRHLGIECSGFIAHILDAWVKESKGKRIFQALEFSHVPFWKKIVVWLRPFTHIDISTLTSPRNSKEFFRWEELMPGDLIRFNTDIDHALLVVRTIVAENGIPTSVHYVQSVQEKTGVGVKEGVITITNADLPLSSQKWAERPETGTTIIQRSTEPRLYHPLFL